MCDLPDRTLAGTLVRCPEDQQKQNLLFKLLLKRCYVIPAEDPDDRVNNWLRKKAEELLVRGLELNQEQMQIARVTRPDKGQVQKIKSR